MEVLQLVVKFFNTYLRATLNARDVRTAYNILNQYRILTEEIIRAGMDEDGATTTWLHRTSFPSIVTTFAPNIPGPQPNELSLGAFDSPWDVPNLRIEACDAPAHLRIGWLRSVYHIFYAFGINAFTDELAHAAGMNMVQLLHKIYDASTDPEHEEQVKRSRGVLDKVVEMSGVGKDLPANHGIGLAVHHSFRSYAAMAAHVEVNGGKVTVHRVDCAADCGLVLNPDIATAQMEGAVTMGMGIAFNPDTGLFYVTGKDFVRYHVSTDKRETLTTFSFCDSLPGGGGDAGKVHLATQGGDLRACLLVGGQGIQRGIGLVPVAQRGLGPGQGDQHPWIARIGRLCRCQ